MSVAIGYVHSDLVHHRWMASLRAAEEYEDALILDEGSGPSVAAARNKVVRRFLDSGRDWLYMTDTDTVFKADTIERLSARGKQVISALVYVAGETPFPMMFQRIADIGSGIGAFHLPPEWMRAAWDRGADGCLQVDAVGAGCLLVHRDVYLEVEKSLQLPIPWYQETSMGNMVVGEDFTFCMRLAECGYEIFVDTDVRVGHMKYRMV
jgi:hypothetical protein